MNKRKRYRSSEWSGLLEQWSRSGESAERFSARLGITVGTLARWQKKAQGSRKSNSSMVGATPKSIDTGGSAFTPVQVVRPERTESGLVEVVTRSGCVVRVHGAVDEETLALVLAAVGGC